MLPITPSRPSSSRPDASVSADDARLNAWLLWSLEKPAPREVLSIAELAECRCPDLCDRDHANE